jgi:hypothetical protein
VAGALTERDLVTKLEKAGFHDIRIHARQPLSIDDLALYPLFTPDLLALMRRHITPAAQTEIGTVVVVSARANGVSADEHAAETPHGRALAAARNGAGRAAAST